MRPHPSHLLVGGALPGFTVAASPGSASVSSSSGGALTTPSVTVSQTSGPSSSLSYAWSRVSGDASIVANSPTAALTTFNGNPAGTGTISAVMRCTVTNGFGQTASVDVTVTITRTPPPFSVTCSPGTYSDLGLAAGTPVSVGSSASAANGDGSYTFSWHLFGVGSLSTTSGANTTWSIGGQPAGTTVDVTLACNGSDTSGHSDTGNTLIHLKWN